MLKRKQGTGPRNKGRAGERQFARLLNAHFAKLSGTLTAVAVPGSGALAHRDGMEDPHFAGDVQIRRTRDKSIVDFIEVKRGDPNAKAGPIRLAHFKRGAWGKFRRMLAARHDRAEWVCWMWASTQDDLESKGGVNLLVPSLALEYHGTSIAELHRPLSQYGAVRLKCDLSSFYMNIATLARLLDAAYGEAEACDSSTSSQV